MNLTFQLLKNHFPELNEKVIERERIVEVLGRKGIPVFDVPMAGKGAYVRDLRDGAEYVFIKNNLESLLYHETLCYEGTHALCHVPAAKFLERRQNLQAEVFSLVMMMPLKDLPRLNRLKHEFDADVYERLKRRNQVKEMWRI